MRSIIDAQQRYFYKTRVMFFYMLKYKKKNDDALEKKGRNR